MAAKNAPTALWRPGGGVEIQWAIDRRRGPGALPEPIRSDPRAAQRATSSGFWTPEVGLFWAIDAAYRRQGYASEAAQALIDFAFNEMRLGRIIATTETDNLASQAVMRKLGMRICHNPLPTPPGCSGGVLEKK